MLGRHDPRKSVQRVARNGAGARQVGWRAHRKGLRDAGGMGLILRACRSKTIVASGEHGFDQGALDGSIPGHEDIPRGRAVGMANANPLYDASGQETVDEELRRDAAWQGATDAAEVQEGRQKPFGTL